MSDMTRILVILALATLAFVSLAEAQELPDDFRLVATYSAGFSTWKLWETTITADGKATQKISPGRNGGEDSRKESALTDDDLKALAAVIKDAEFSELKDSYRSRATDQPTLVLEITQGKQTHKVEVYGPSLLKTGEDGDAARRFLHIYSEVLRKVPSPNPEQTPELYSSKK